MLGQRYLETRLALAEVLNSVKLLAIETRTNFDELDQEGVAECIVSPLRIAVCGEPLAGKTSFINALLGTDFEHDDERPIHVYGSSVLWSEPTGEHINYTQIRELDELEIVDNRGISDLDPEQREALKSVLSESDHVFYIISAENPWAAKTWDMVTEMKDHLGKRCSVILQKTDLLKKRDLDILSGHLTSLSIQRVGHKLEIFQVSAEKGLSAWNDDKRDGRKWNGSGFNLVEDSLNNSLSTGAERKGALEYVSSAIRAVINRVENTIESKVSAHRSDVNILKKVEAEVENAREIEIDNATESLAHLSSVISEHVGDTMSFARKKNGFLSTVVSIFSRGDGALVIEKKLQDQVSEAAYVRAREIAYNLLAKCENQWRGMRDDLQKRMAVDVVGFDSKMFESNVNKFSENMQKKTKQSLVTLKLRRLLDRMMVARQRVLKQMLCWFFAVISAASLIGYCYPDSKLPFVVLGISVISLIRMMLFSNKTKKVLLRAYAERINNAKFELSDMLEEDYVAELREFYTGYTSMFENLRRYIVQCQEEVVPLQEQWHTLFLSYKAVDQDI